MDTCVLLGQGPQVLGLDRADRACAEARQNRPKLLGERHERTDQLRDLGRTGSVVGRLSGTGTLGAILATFVTGMTLSQFTPRSAR